MTYELVAADTLDPTQTSGLRKIYESAYADADRAPWSRVCVGRLAAEHPVALLDSDVAIGFALLRVSSDADYAVLRHFVIDPAHRGRGIGVRFWRLVGAYARERGCRLLVWDVAAPDGDGSQADDHPVGNGRSGIYERASGSLVPVGEYDDPSSRDDSIRTVPMRLVATALGGDGPDPPDARALRRIALDVCAQRYEFAIETSISRASIDSAYEL